MDSTIIMLTEKVEKVVIAIGKGIGKSAKYVYPIMVKQQFLEGIVALSVFIFFTVVAFISYKNIEGWDSQKNECGVSNIIFIVAMIGVCISFVVAVTSMGQLFNPEYYALKEIMGMVK